MQTKTPLEERILNAVAPAAADLGYEVVRLRVQGGSQRKRLQIMAERADGGMGVEDCAALSRAVSAVLDVEDPFEGQWDLEVSSPGIDRPLTKAAHFARWDGFDVKIELDLAIEGRRRFAGVLAGFEDDHVLLDPPDEEVTLAIPFDRITDARLVLTDALIAESLRRGAAHTEDTLGEDVERELDEPPQHDDQAARQTQDRVKEND